MGAKPTLSFGLDRLKTPIGMALLVTDADGVLRALDWEEHEPRMRELLRLQYGAVDLKDARAPRRTQGGADRLFQGRSRSPEGESLARRRHAVPAQGLDRAAEDPAPAPR